MSLISDALKKGGASPPQSPALPPSPPKPRFKKGAAWFSAVLICAGVLLLRQESASRRALPPQPLPPPQGQPIALQDDSVPKPAPSQPQQRPGLNLLRTAENSWKLNGVLRGGDGQPLALINNQVVEQGAIVRGAKLVRVNDTSVELEEDGQTRTLKLR